MLTPEPDRSILTAALKKRFVEEELYQIEEPVWNTTLGCWTFYHKGQLWGVEPDGYIHT